MAIEWNEVSVGEILLKMEMAKGVKVAINEIKNSLKNCLTLEVFKNKNLEESYYSICSSINLLYINEEYEENDEIEEIEIEEGSLYKYNLRKSLVMRDIISLQSIEEELTPDEFFEICNKESLIKLKYFDYCFDGNLDIDSLEEMVSSGQCLVSITIKDEFIVRYIKNNIDTDGGIEDFIRILEKFYFMESTLLSIEGDFIAIFGIHDIYSLGDSSIGGEESKVCINLAENAIKILTFKELIKRGHLLK